MYTLRKVKRGDTSQTQHNTYLGKSYLTIENKDSEEFKSVINENLNRFQLIGIDSIQAVLKCQDNDDIALVSGYDYYIMLDGKTIDKRYYQSANMYVHPVQFKIGKVEYIDMSDINEFPIEDKGTVFKMKKSCIVSGIQLHEDDIILYIETNNKPYVIPKMEVTQYNTVSKWNDSYIPTSVLKEVLNKALNNKTKHF